ncbi:MAG TPA: hypothetical protein VKF35_15000 [Hyphomicrobiaceae bacterium]|nr:hypothetical protein [Hyphomicrobiaceae bacterium]
MFGQVVRILVGFIVACLVAGLTLVLFVYTPVELASLGTDVILSRLAEAGILTLAVATQAAVFAAPFALIGAVGGEWRQIRSPAYYALLGLLIAALGFYLQYRSEAGGEFSILNSYALSAFALTGLLAGLAYWLCAGRSSGGRAAAVPSGETPPAANLVGAKPEPAAELPKA